MLSRPPYSMRVGKTQAGARPVEWSASLTRYLWHNDCQKGRKCRAAVCPHKEIAWLIAEIRRLRLNLEALVQRIRDERTPHDSATPNRVNGSDRVRLLPSTPLSTALPSAQHLRSQSNSRAL